MRTRTAEMFLATVMTSFGAILAAPGSTLNLPHYNAMREWVTILPGSETLFGLILCGVGVMRWIALIVNGYHHSTPGWRMIGCIVGSLFWTSLTVSFVTAVPVLPGVPGALAWTIPAVIFEWYSAARVTVDAFAADSFGIKSWAVHRDRANGALNARRNP